MIEKMFIYMYYNGRKSEVRKLHAPVASRLQIHVAGRGDTREIDARANGRDQPVPELVVNRKTTFREVA